ncbi:MAG: hypothetical protein RL662_1854 [Bacteroidota bacterium]|jgi:hypothetical protein
MPDKITDTAILLCDKGVTPTPLTVTSQTFCFAEGKLIATEQDKQAMINIKPFGICKLKPSITGYLPCTPAPIAWQNPTPKDEINGYKILTDQSECSCATGGTIKVQSKGHSENHDTE